MNSYSLLPLVALVFFSATVHGQPMCFTGTSAEVTDMCAMAVANCCTGSSSPCSWAGTATVCENSCVGLFACQNIPTGAVIRENSCDGLSACRNTAGTSPKTTFEIGPNSCRDGSSVCQSLGANAMSVVVGPNSCDGEVACLNVGLNAMSVVIGNDSCRDGGFVCTDLANTLPTELQVLIGDESCRGQGACNLLAAGLPASITSLQISTTACNGEGSCQNLGRDLTGTAVEELIVEAGVCVGDPNIDMGVCEDCLRGANTDNLDGVDVDMDPATTQRLSITDSNQCPNGDASNTFDFNLITPAPSLAPSISAAPSGRPSSSAAPSFAPSISAAPSMSLSGKKGGSKHDFFSFFHRSGKKGGSKRGDNDNGKKGGGNVEG